MRKTITSAWPRMHVLAACIVALLLAACENAELPTGEDIQTNQEPEVIGHNTDQSATVGLPFSYDASKGGSVFDDPDGDPLIYGVKLSPAGIGLVANTSLITGTPTIPATVSVTVTADDGKGGLATDHFSIMVAQNSVPTLVNANPDQAAAVGAFYSYDATRGGTAFSDAEGQNLTYNVAFSPLGGNGLSANGGTISGTPASPGIIAALITATDESGNTANDVFSIVSFGTTATPNLPGTLFAYADGSINLPAHFTNGNVDDADNTPNNNRTTNAGATLGRVLFYDTRLSANDTEACASCHHQANSFADPVRFSEGFDGGLTGRNSPSLANARYYERENAFWDERAATFEVQALMPIQDAVEMGLTLDELETKLRVTDYYPPLFQAAFGTPEITRDRVARALAQFVRSMVSFQSKFDQAFTNGNPDFGSVFTAQEQLGEQIFDNEGCDRCHSTNAHISDNIHNTGLDATTTDNGAGGARFKSPSLRNIAVSAPYMHDGRFNTLEEVVEFYNSGVQAHPNLDGRLETNGQPDRMNLTQAEKDALVAFLMTLTDNAFLTDPKFSDPFNN